MLMSIEIMVWLHLLVYSCACRQMRALPRRKDVIEMVKAPAHKSSKRAHLRYLPVHLLPLGKGKNHLSL